MKQQVKVIEIILKIGPEFEPGLSHILFISSFGQVLSTQNIVQTSILFFFLNYREQREINRQMNTPHNIN